MSKPAAERGLGPAVLVVTLCVVALFLGGFYGCRSVLRGTGFFEFSQTQKLTEITHITQTYIRLWHETGEWPTADSVVYSDLHPVGERINVSGERVDIFPSPFGRDSFLEFHLLDHDYVRVESTGTNRSDPDRVRTVTQ
ncbi:MAG: hypothetical protein AAF800_11795 [Planctomycetota bacterium]